MKRVEAHYLGRLAGLLFGALALAPIACSSGLFVESDEKIIRSVLVKDQRFRQDARKKFPDELKSSVDSALPMDLRDDVQARALMEEMEEGEVYARVYREYVNRAKAERKVLDCPEDFRAAYSDYLGAQELMCAASRDRDWEAFEKASQGWTDAFTRLKEVAGRYGVTPRKN